MSNENIEEIYADLYEQLSTRPRKSLKIIKQACDSQVNIKATDFSYATIGRLSYELGGVDAHYINKKGGELHKRLINAYQANYSLPKTKSNPLRDPLIWVNEIEDAAIRFQVLNLVSENKRIQNELNLLKANTVLDVDLRVPTASKQVKPALENMLDHDELQALAHFISPQNLKNFGWEIGTNGRLIDKTGDKARNTTKIGFIDAIEKIITIQGE